MKSFYHFKNLVFKILQYSQKKFFVSTVGSLIELTLFVDKDVARQSLHL